MRCERCGEENPGRARFCSSCGAQLIGGTRQERKVVSVLFVDLVGFTGRADGRDPEDVRDVLQSYHRTAEAAISSFGGNLEKFIGDAVMAVFGAPLSHGDDAERAVRAGLKVLESVKDLGLEARAAVNTGEAVVAVGAAAGSGQALAMGDVVNTASRLQSSAPPGEPSRRSPLLPNGRKRRWSAAIARCSCSLRSGRGRPLTADHTSSRFSGRRASASRACSASSRLTSANGTAR